MTINDFSDFMMIFTTRLTFIYATLAVSIKESLWFYDKYYDNYVYFHYNCSMA